VRNSNGARTIDWQTCNGELLNLENGIKKKKKGKKLNYNFA